MTATGCGGSTGRVDDLFAHEFDSVGTVVLPTLFVIRRGARFATKIAAQAR
jgi:hypothetical protein